MSQSPCLRLAHTGWPRSLLGRMLANTDIRPENTHTATLHHGAACPCRWTNPGGGANPGGGTYPAALRTSESPILGYCNSRRRPPALQSRSEKAGRSGPLESAGTSVWRTQIRENSQLGTSGPHVELDMGQTLGQKGTHWVRHVLTGPEASAKPRVGSPRSRCPSCISG